MMLALYLYEKLFYLIHRTRSYPLFYIILSYENEQSN
jgi:hypothetical protein